MGRTVVKGLLGAAIALGMGAFALCKSPAFDDQYDARAQECVQEVKDSFISPETFNAYSGRFTCEEILEFDEYGIDPETANEYDERFTSFDILAQFYSSGYAFRSYTQHISPSVANSVPAAFTAKDIYNAWNERHLGYVFELDDHFDYTGAKWLMTANIPQDMANKYPKHLCGAVITELYKEEISPTKAAEYATHFDVKCFKTKKGFDGEDRISVLDGVETLVKNDVPPLYANQFSEDRSVDFIVDCYKQDIDAQVANKFDLSLSAREVELLIDAQVTPEKGKEVMDQLGYDVVYEFGRANISAEKALGYPDMEVDDIFVLIKANVAPYMYANLVNQYANDPMAKKCNNPNPTSEDISSVECAIIMKRDGNFEAYNKFKGFTDYQAFELWDAEVSPRRANLVQRMNARHNGILMFDQVMDVAQSKMTTSQINQVIYAAYAQ